MTNKPTTLRRGAPGALLLLLLLGAHGAGAQSFTSFQFYTRDPIDPDRDGLEDGINSEECEAGSALTMRYTYSGSAGAGDLEMWIGASCDVKENRDDGKCHQAIDGGTVQPSANIDIEPAWVVDPGSSNPQCVEGEGTNNVYLWLVGGDADETIVTAATPIGVGYDTKAPPAPVDVTVSYGEGKATVRWEVENSDKPDDWKYFVVLCTPKPSSGTTAQDASSDGDAAGSGGGDPGDEDDDAVEEAPADEEAADGDAADVSPDDGEEPAADGSAEADAGADVSDAASDRRDAASGDTTGEEDEECPAGGFKEGDALGSQYVCSDLLGSGTRSLQVNGLANGTAYKFAVVAYDKYRNPSTVSAVACATPQQVDDFWEVYKKNGGKAKGEFCFVATAAYGSPLHPFVGRLRDFRDEVLAPSGAGRALVAAYYRHSPAAAAAIGRSPALRLAARVALLPAVGVAVAAVAAARHPALAAAALLAAACALLALRRRGRRGSTAAGALLLAAGALVAAPSELRAKEAKNWMNGGLPGESRQMFAFELKFGPYYPQVDGEFGDGSTPYRDVFGTNDILYTQGEFDWQFVHPPGFSLALGGTIGFFQDKGKALLPGTNERSGEETVLNVMPWQLDLVIRIDALLRYTVVPLVPYVKGGVSYYIWWIENGSGIASFEGKDARGGTWGWNIQAGLMICLDPIEPTAARTFDNEVGVNNSYIFAEFLLARIDGFGAKDVLRLSDTTWNLGLAVEF